MPCTIQLRPLWPIPITSTVVLVRFLVAITNWPHATDASPDPRVSDVLYTRRPGDKQWASKQSSVTAVQHHRGQRVYVVSADDMLGPRRAAD
jgi:hypothetical protein